MKKFKTIALGLLLVLPLVACGANNGGNGGNGGNTEGGGTQGGGNTEGGGTQGGGNTEGGGGTQGGGETTNEFIIDVATLGFEDGQEVSSFTQNGYTFTFGQGDSQNKTKYYENGTNLRMYKGNTLTITGGTLTKVEFEIDTKEDGAFTTAAGTINGNVWTGNVSELKFTVAVGSAEDSKGQRRIKKLLLISLLVTLKAEAAPKVVAVAEPAVVIHQLEKKLQLLKLLHFVKL